jgi:hypothetical protein
MKGDGSAQAVGAAGPCERGEVEEALEQRHGNAHQLRALLRVHASKRNPLEQVSELLVMRCAQPGQRHGAQA